MNIKIYKNEYKYKLGWLYVIIFCLYFVKKYGFIEVVNIIYIMYVCLNGKIYL